MKRFTSAGRAAIEVGNLYAGFVMALMIPDICSSLENPGPGKSEKRYIAWCKKWLESRFTSNVGPERRQHIFVTAEDCYQIRCSVIHSGRSDIYAKKRKKLGSFEFFDKEVGSHLNWFGEIMVNGAMHPGFLQLRADKFAEEIFFAAEEWDSSVLDNKKIQEEKKKLLRIHSKGTTFPGGITFG